MYGQCSGEGDGRASWRATCHARQDKTTWEERRPSNPSAGPKSISGPNPTKPKKGRDSRDDGAEGQVDVVLYLLDTD